MKNIIIEDIQPLPKKEIEITTFVEFIDELFELIFLKNFFETIKKNK